METTKVTRKQIETPFCLYYSLNKEDNVIFVPVGICKKMALVPSLPSDIHVGINYLDKKSKLKMNIDLNVKSFNLNHTKNIEYVMRFVQLMIKALEFRYKRDFLLLWDKFKWQHFTLSRIKSFIDYLDCSKSDTDELRLENGKGRIRIIKNLFAMKTLSEIENSWYQNLYFLSSEGKILGLENTLNNVTPHTYYLNSYVLNESVFNLCESFSKGKKSVVDIIHEVDNFKMNILYMYPKDNDIIDVDSIRDQQFNEFEEEIKLLKAENLTKMDAIQEYDHIVKNMQETIDSLKKNNDELTKDVEDYQLKINNIESNQFDNSSNDENSIYYEKYKNEEEKVRLLNEKVKMLENENNGIINKYNQREMNYANNVIYMERKSMAYLSKIHALQNEIIAHYKKDERRQDINLKINDRTKEKNTLKKRSRDDSGAYLLYQLSNKNSLNKRNKTRI